MKKFVEKSICKNSKRVYFFLTVIYFLNPKIGQISVDFCIYNIIINNY